MCEKVAFMINLGAALQVLGGIALRTPAAGCRSDWREGECASLKGKITGGPAARS
jgi:hypothetical protein